MLCLWSRRGVWGNSDAELAMKQEAPHFNEGRSHITNPCYAASDPSVSLSLSRSQSSVKCYMADTGLLCALALANGATTAEELYRNVLLGNVSINEGMLVENFVA